MILEKTNLRKIASLLNDTGIPPRFEPHQSQLLIKVWRMVAKGKPVVLKQITALASEIRRMIYAYPANSHDLSYMV